MAHVTDVYEYMERVADALGGELANGEFSHEVTVSSVDEAKLQRKKILQQQKQLIQIKREINQDIKYIRNLFKEASDNAQPSGLSSFASLFGLKEYAKSDVAQQRRELRQTRESVLKPFNQAKLTINDVLIQLEAAKRSIQIYIEENK